MESRSAASIVRILALASLAGAAPALAGLHIGEARDLAADIQYSGDVAIINGVPSFRIGSQAGYQVTLNNEGTRDYNDFQVRGVLTWVDNSTCNSGGKTYNYTAGQTLPGNSDSGWRAASMSAGGSASFYADYQVPSTVCPGSKFNLVLWARHANNGQSSAGGGAFSIPPTATFVQ